MREAMDGKAGIGILALSGRDYLVAVQPKDRGLVMYTLRHARELRNMNAIEEIQNLPDKVSHDEVALAQQVIGSFEGDLDLSEFRDQYQEELRNVIDGKSAGAEVIAPVEEASPKVVNLIEALRKSLDSVRVSGSAAKKKAAEVQAMPSRTASRRRRARS